MLNLHVQCFFCKTIFSGTHILIFDWRPQYSSSLHKWSPISCRSSVGQGQFAGKIPTFYHCTTQPTNIISNFDKFDDEELKILPKDKYTKEFADFWSKSNCNYFYVQCGAVQCFHAAVNDRCSHAQCRRVHVAWLRRQYKLFPYILHILGYILIRTRNFWTVNLIMQAKKLLSSRQIFQYAVPARTVTKKSTVHVLISPQSARNQQR